LPFSPLERGYRDLTAIDLSTTALQVVRDRLDPAGDAVYHFLTEPDEREDYLASLERSLEPGGHAVVATFGPNGPTTCSGLPIVRYTHDELAAQFPDYELLGTAGDDHETPWGSTQQFTAVHLRRPG